MSSSVPSCPRCGYDLGGDIASWNGEGSAACPSAGRCSECGLDFEWADIFNPFRNKVRGFIEHADGRLFRNAWSTWWMAVRPWRFWKLVRIEFEPRPGRMLLWLVLVTAGFWVLGPLASNATQLYLMLRSPLPWRASAFIDPWLEGVVRQQYTLLGISYVPALPHLPGFVLGPLAVSVFTPLTLLCLPDTRRLARVRVVHVARASVYGLAWLIPMVLLKSLNQIAEAITWIAWAWPTGRVAGRAPAAVDWYNRAGWALHRTWMVWALLVLAWVGAWWWWALRAGWRVEEYEKVMRALVVIGVLAAAAAVMLSDDGYRLFL